MLIQSLRRVSGCECRKLGRGNVCDECQRRECCEWNWDKDGTGSTVVFNNDDRDVIFNPGFSVGTAAVRGSQPFKQGYHHYWEIEMSTEVYGTDMMIGVGTEKTDLRKYSHNFVSLIGMDSDSWGLSYSGEKKHGGQSHRYAKPFGQHSVIGVHLDLWSGTLEFYMDRKPLGLAFNGLRDKVLYPIISSTAARSGMNLIFCRSYPSSLQLQAMLTLSQTSLSPDESASLFQVLSLPPGLKHWMKNNYWWIASCRDRDRKREEELNNRAKPLDEASASPSRESRQAVRQQRNLAGVVDGESESELGEEEEVSNETTSSASADDEESTTSPSETERCTQQSENGDNVNCLRLLATSSRAHFLGRISPIFIGLPEGGFSMLPSRSSNSNILGRSVIRSRSVPAKPSSSSAMIVSASASSSRLVRQCIEPQSSSSEDEEESGPSARREPKRLRLRESIEQGDEDEGGVVKEPTVGNDCSQQLTESNL